MCHCPTLPELIYYDQRPSGFEDSFAKVADGPWVELFRCGLCGQLWRIDVWDKYQVRFAAKITTQNGWIEFNTTTFQKSLILKERGGYGDSTCICINCNNPTVKGMLICIDHLYGNGNRK